jgi:hypothetical protein
MKQLLFPWLVVVAIQQGHAFCIFPFKKKPFGHDLQLPMFWFKLVNDVCLVQQIHFYCNGKYVHCIGMKRIMSSYIWRWKISIYMFTK